MNDVEKMFAVLMVERDLARDKASDYKNSLEQCRAQLANEIKWVKIHQKKSYEEHERATALEANQKLLLSVSKECLENTGGGFISAYVIEKARAVVEMIELSPPVLGKLTPEQEKAAEANVKQEKK